MYREKGSGRGLKMIYVWLMCGYHQQLFKPEKKCSIIIYIVHSKSQELLSLACTEYTEGNRIYYKSWENQYFALMYAYIEMKFVIQIHYCYDLGAIWVILDSFRVNPISQISNITIIKTNFPCMFIIFYIREISYKSQFIKSLPVISNTRQPH